jgi:hypothetical protein
MKYQKGDIATFRLAFAHGSIEPEGKVFNSLEVFDSLGSVRRCYNPNRNLPAKKGQR